MIGSCHIERDPPRALTRGGGKVLVRRSQDLGRVDSGSGHDDEQADCTAHRSSSSELQGERSSLIA